MVGSVFPLFRVPTQAQMLAERFQTPARLQQIKHKEDGLFTRLAYTSVARCFLPSKRFVLLFFLKYEQRSSLPCELGNFGNSKLRHVNQRGFRPMGFQQRLRNSRP